jgi:hypothetical protein
MQVFKKFIVSALAAGAMLAAPSAALASAAQPASVPASAAAARVAGTTRVPAVTFSHEKCGTGSSSGNVTTCIMVVSHSTGFLARAIAKVRRTERSISECLRTPFGTRCTGFHSVGAGGSLSETVTGSGQAPNGTYCASTYRQNSSGPPTRIGHVCLTKG